ncbi:MAG: ATP-binding protein [Planctomycetaceae bacterium]
MPLSDRLPFANSKTKGYRLHKIELWNWGTFDGHVFTVRPEGHSALLIGQNGSGKSTLVDALLTLLVRPGVRNFNVAAGAKKRERDERSYLKGAYDRSSDEEGHGISVKYLRPKGEQYSVILACFHNGDLGKTFTVAQVLYLTGDQSVEKIYCFAEGERSIQKDFQQLESSENILKVLRSREFRATRTFQEFEGWFSKITRVKPKAMEVFNQTVAVKDIQRLNDFIRDHMLEPHDWGEKVDRLLGHFTQLSEAHDSLVRVRQQRDLLEPVAKIGTEYRQQADALERAERLVRASSAYFSQRTIDLFTPAVTQKEQELHDIQRRKESVATETRDVQDRIRNLRNEIERAGGDRLRQIPRLIDVERAHSERKRQSCTRLNEALEQLGVIDPIDGETAFAALQSRMPALQAELDEETSRLRRERDERLLARGQSRQQLAALRDEWEGLNRRKENIPEWCVQLRRSLCDELGLPGRDLPFAAELMQVLTPAREWESSIEKVLHGFALSLLVPDKYYQVVAAHVDRTPLTALGRGQRLVYLRVAEQAGDRGAAAPGPRSLINKLGFREGHPLLPWLKAELQDRFDYTCCDTVEEFQESRGLTVTRHRHIKSGRRRHEKDDREEAVDPRHFVLGWDNREKKQRLAAEIERLASIDSTHSARLGDIEAELSRLQIQLLAIIEVQRISGFSEVDFSLHEREIVRLEEERRVIEEGSDAMRVLKRHLTDAEADETALRLRYERLVGDERELKNRIADASKLIANAEADLKRRESDGSLGPCREAFSDLDAELSEPPLSADDLLERREQFRVEQDERIVKLKQRVEPIRNRLTDAMSRFLRACPEEAADMRASVDYLDSFLGFRQQIVEDDLPRHEQRFKERLNQKVIEEIGLFRSALEQERRKIEDKIDLLNVSLKKLEYRAGTHIQLQPRPIRDADITEFQSRLRECVEGSFEDSAEANETRFARIKELIIRLRDDDDRHWRVKVTDVRRWFDFVAAVIDRRTGETVSAYHDSSGQSGGEKAKLAFTILVAAIAYQYDLDPEHPVSDRFHFVVVDEMFSKVDDQHAEYALDLFKQFGLQLLIVAPLDAKARVTQPYVGCYLHVVKRQNRSTIFEMTAQEFEECAGRPDDASQLEASYES